MNSKKEGRGTLGEKLEIRRENPMGRKKERGGGRENEEKLSVADGACCTASWQKRKETRNRGGEKG